MVDCNITANYFVEKRRMTKRAEKGLCKLIICYVTTYKCPNCGGQFTDNGLLNYCYRCGQRFDWSDKMGGEE